MKNRWKKAGMTAIMVILALSMLLMGGCSGDKNTAAETGIAGTILLSVNPEIEVGYDENGMVVEIEGVNDDGKDIIAEYKDYEGKDCDVVVNELVKRIYDAGYFKNTVRGHEKNIVIKLEEGSRYPGDDFLEMLAKGVQETAAKCGLDSVPVVVDEDDMDDETGYIGLEKAKELVLAQLGMSEASFRDKKYELDDGVYELEFVQNGVKYEFEVDAVSGKVLEADREHNDDWDDDDKDDLYDKDDKDDINEKDDLYDNDDKDDPYDDDNKDDLYGDDDDDSSGVSGNDGKDDDDDRDDNDDNDNDGDDEDDDNDNDDDRNED